MSFKLGKRRLKKYNPEFKRSWPGVSRTMIKLFGTEVTVIKITTTKVFEGELATIREDTRGWAWRVEWFEDETEWGFGV